MNNQLQLVSGAAAVLGGTLLIAKAVAILTTGNQPPLLFEVAPIALALAFQGLLVLVKPAGFRRTIVQSVIIATVISAIAGITTGTAVNEGLSSLFDVVAGLGPMALLIYLGRLVMITRSLAGSWRFLPVALGLGTIPALIVGAILEATLGERFLEIPLLVIGLAWILTGHQMWKQRKYIVS